MPRPPGPAEASPQEARHYAIKTRLEIVKLALWAVFRNTWEAIRTFTS